VKGKATMVSCKVIPSNPPDLSIEKAIEDQLNSLDYFLSIIYKSEYKEFSEEVAEKIERGNTFESMAEYYFISIDIENKNIENKPRNKIGQAVFYDIGAADICNLDSYKQFLADKNAKHSSNRVAGRSRHIKYQPAIEKAIQLLTERRPDGGWKNRSSAAKTIAAEMKEFITANRLSLQPHCIEQTLVTWMRKKEHVAAAYNSSAEHINTES
jgi:hypothetical protein